jgi:hypothetical protein
MSKGFCPDGWKYLGDSKCEAQSTNKGTCTKISQFGGWYNIQNWTNMCSTKWDNCKQLSVGEIAPFGECQIGTCPDGWKDIGNNQCQNQGTNKGTCPTISTFGGYSNMKKMQWASGCNTEWSNCDQLKNGEVAHTGQNNCKYASNSKLTNTCTKNIEQCFNKDGNIIKGNCVHNNNVITTTCNEDNNDCNSTGKYGNANVDNIRYWNKEKKTNSSACHLGHQLESNVGYCSTIFTRTTQGDNSIKLSLAGAQSITVPSTFHSFFKNAIAICISAIPNSSRVQFPVFVTDMEKNTSGDWSVTLQNGSKFVIPKNTQGFTGRVPRLFITPSPITNKAKSSPQVALTKPTPPEPYRKPKSMDTLNVAGGLVESSKGNPTIKCPSGKCPKGCDVPENGMICSGHYTKKDGKCYKTCKYTCKDMNLCKYDSCCSQCGTKLVEVPCITDNYKESQNKNARYDGNNNYIGKYEQEVNCLEKCQDDKSCYGIVYYNEHNGDDSFKCYSLTKDTGEIYNNPVSQQNVTTYYKSQHDATYYKNKLSK